MATTAIRQADRHGNIYYTVEVDSVPIGTVWRMAGGRWKAVDPKGAGSTGLNTKHAGVELLEFWHRLRTT